jgi:hypothetical protein
MQRYIAMIVVEWKSYLQRENNRGMYEEIIRKKFRSYLQTQIVAIDKKDGKRLSSFKILQTQTFFF